MIKLELCPFCGGKADLIADGTKVCIFCAECRAQICHSTSGNLCNVDDINETIEKWNRRASNEQS